MKLRARAGLSLAVAAIILPADSAAQWFRLPNGKLAFRADYTSSATFACGTWFINGGGCRVLGNTLILRNGGSTMTISWEPPREGSLVAAWSQTHRFLVGTIRTRVTGAPFVFPTMATNPALVFQMHMRFSGPYSGITDPAYYAFSQGPNNTLRSGWTNIGLFGFPGAGGDSRTGLIWYSFKTRPSLDPRNGELDIWATTGIAMAPEPTTLALFATGAAVVGAAARRRRKHANGTSTG